MAAPVITPGGPLALQGKVTQIFEADQPVTWTTSGGTLEDVLAAEVTWRSPNVAGVYTLTATNGALEEDEVVITLVSVLPNYWDWRSPAKIKKGKLIWEPENGPDQTRLYRPKRQFYDFTCNDKSFEMAEELVAFWDAHDPNLKFLIIDPAMQRTSYYKTDSDIEVIANPGGESWDLSFSVKEAWPYGAA